MFEQALNMTLKLFERNPNAYRSEMANVWYNKACLESLKNNKEKPVEFLQKPIELNKKYLNDAKTDEVFDNIRNSKEFKELIVK